MTNKYLLVSKDTENAFNAEIDWLAEEGYEPLDILQVHSKESNVYFPKSFVQMWVLKNSQIDNNNFLIRVFINRETGKWDFEIDKIWLERLYQHYERNHVIELVEAIFSQIIAMLSKRNK